jgi:hypothetical protein
MRKLRKIIPRVIIQRMSLILSILLRYLEQANRIILLSGKHAGSITTAGTTNLSFPERGIGGGLSKKDESTVPQSRGYTAAPRTPYLFRVSSERPDLTAARI